MTPADEATAVQLAQLNETARELWRQKASKDEVSVIRQTVRDQGREIQDKASAAEVSKLSDDVRSLRNAILAASTMVMVAAIVFALTVLQQQGSGG